MRQKLTHKMQSNDGKPYKEKASLQSLLKIIKEIRLNWLDCFTFSIHSLLGAIILPLSFKLIIETVAALAHTLSLEYAESLAPIFERFLNIFQYAQWPLFAIIVAIYWFRCNVKAYNYSFTQSVGAKIRKQLGASDTLTCPRCGKPMRLQRFTEKIREQTGEHEEYYTEWIGFGTDKTPITQKEIVADYSDVEYERQYAICQNPYCMYTDKRPLKSDVGLYKFAEMPYKISDTINYAVRTKATTNRAAGDIKQYSRGISLLGYLVICIAMLVICMVEDLPCLNFFEQQNERSTFFFSLGITEGIVLCCSAVFQIIVHVRHRKQTNDYIEIKTQTKDGATFVLPDGSEFYAKTDRRLQNMYDMYSAMSRMKDSASEDDE